MSGKRNSVQLARDRKLASDLAAAGYNQFDIADRINELAEERGENYTITRSTIENDLRILRKEYLNQATDTVETIIGTELMRLDRIVYELLRAWERSKNPRQIKQTRIKGNQGKKKKRKGAKDDVAVEQLERTEGRDGNPRFLEAAIRAIAMKITVLRPDLRGELGKDEGERLRELAEGIMGSFEGARPVDVEVREADNGKPKPGKNGKNGKAR